MAPSIEEGVRMWQTRPSVRPLEYRIGVAFPTPAPWAARSTGTLMGGCSRLRGTRRQPSFGTTRLHLSGRGSMYLSCGTHSAVTPAHSLFLQHLGNAMIHGSRTGEFPGEFPRCCARGCSRPCSQGQSNKPFGNFPHTITTLHSDDCHS